LLEVVQPGGIRSFFTGMKRLCPQAIRLPTICCVGAQAIIRPRRMPRVGGSGRNSALDRAAKE